MGACSSWCTKSDSESQIRVENDRNRFIKKNRDEKILIIQSVLRTYLSQKQAKAIKKSVVKTGVQEANENQENMNQNNYKEEDFEPYDGIDDAMYDNETVEEISK